MLLTIRYNFRNDFSRTPLSLHPAILGVNRQINEEATNVLHGENIWIIGQINVPQWPDPSSVLPFASMKDPSCIRYPSLHLKLDLLQETTATHSTTLIMGVESLPVFLHQLRRRSLRGSRADGLKTAGLTLKLYSSPFHSQLMLQSKCLEPFTMVRGLGQFSVIGEPDLMGTCYREDMMRRATSPFKDVEFVTNIAMEYLTRGDNAYSLGNCSEAILHHMMGIVFLRHARESLLPETLAQAHYPYGQQAREELKLWTVMTVAIAHCLRPYFAMGRYRNVLAANEASVVSPQHLTKVEQVGVAFCEAISCYRVGEPKRGMSFMVSACTLEVSKNDFVRVVLSICPEPLRERMRVDKPDYLASIFKMKDQHDERKCKQKGEKEST